MQNAALGEGRKKSSPEMPLPKLMLAAAAAARPTTRYCILLFEYSMHTPYICHMRLPIVVCLHLNIPCPCCPVLYGTVFCLVQLLHCICTSIGLLVTFEFIRKVSLGGLPSTYKYCTGRCTPTVPVQYKNFIPTSA
jgi:hypothetical protein